ncbi:MAG: FG-GAP-like repeat-containing protein [Prevotellaceae bacterium]|nr:FG-GAP-like repeat-containing protein [Prevotellaceae bacterium]
MKQQFNKNYQVRLMCIITLMTLLIPYSFGQIDFDNTTSQILNTNSILVAVEIGDVNNDGLNDIVIAAEKDNTTNEYNIYIYKQLPKGKLSEPVKLPYPGGYYYISDIEIADLNNDGLNDIAILYKGMVGIFYQQADGSFSDVEDWKGPDYYNGIRCGDLNNDGLIDIIGHANKFYQILYQKPEGGFSLTPIGSKINADAFYPSIIEIGDLNNDGLNDIVRIYCSQIEVVFQKAGVLDIANSILLGYSEWCLLGLNKATIGDVNNDEKNDIVVTCGGNDDAGILIYYQTDNGTFSDSNSTRLDAYDIPVPISVVDFNCDGDNEIIVGHGGWSAITMYDKSITGEYDSYVRYSSLHESNPFSMAIGDINNDSRPDVVAVGQNGQFKILYNTSKPLTFDKIEKKTRNLTVTTNISTKTRYDYEVIIDENSECPQNTYYELAINEDFENTHYQGDSIITRYGFLCAEYIDSLEIPFDYIETKLIKSNTEKTIVNFDMLDAFVYESNLAADTDMNFIYVNSNTCWNLSCDQDWLQFNIQSGVMSDYVIVTVTSNESELERTANVIITGNNVPSITIPITQFGTTSSNITDVIMNPDFYINPTTQKLIILSNIVKVKIYDSLGRVALTENLNNTPTEIDLHSLAKGVYVLMLEFSDRSSVVHKIFIQ